MNSSNLVLCPFHGCKILSVGQPDDVTYPQCLLNEPSGPPQMLQSRSRSFLCGIWASLRYPLQQQSSRLIRAITIKQDRQQMANAKNLQTKTKNRRKSCLFEIGRKVIATYYYSSFSLACAFAVPPLSIIASGSSCQPTTPYVISSVSKTSAAARTSTFPLALHPPTQTVDGMLGIISSSHIQVHKGPLGSRLAHNIHRCYDFN